MKVKLPKKIERAAQKGCVIVEPCELGYLIVKDNEDDSYRLLDLESCEIFHKKFTTVSDLIEYYFEENDSIYFPEEFQVVKVKEC